MITNVEYLNMDPILYAGLLFCIERGTARILEEEEQGVLLMDTVSGAYMLATENTEIGKRWLIAHEESENHLLILFQKDLAAWAKFRYERKSMIDCFQAVYAQPAAPPLKGNLQIRTAEIEDWKIISKHYHIVDEYSLKCSIHRKEIFIGLHDDKVIGFVGRHLEGCMGFLEVFPEYRGNGYGTELESYIIKNTLENGMIPYCQIASHNVQSIGLQRKLGLSFSNEHVYVIF